MIHKHVQGFHHRGACCLQAGCPPFTSNLRPTYMQNAIMLHAVSGRCTCVAHANRSQGSGGLHTVYSAFPCCSHAADIRKTVHLQFTHAAHSNCMWVACLLPEIHMLLSYNEKQLVFTCGLHALTSQFSDGSHAETMRMQMEFQ